MEQPGKSLNPPDSHTALQSRVFSDGERVDFLLYVLYDLIEGMREVARQRHVVENATFVQIGVHNVTNKSSEVVSIRTDAIGELIAKMEYIVERVANVVKNQDGAIDLTSVKRRVDGVAEEILLLSQNLHGIEIIAKNCGIVQTGSINEITFEESGSAPLPVVPYEDRIIEKMVRKSEFEENRSIRTNPSMAPWSHLFPKATFERFALYLCQKDPFDMMNQSVSEPDNGPLVDMIQQSVSRRGSDALRRTEVQNAAKGVTELFKGAVFCPEVSVRQAPSLESLPFREAPFLVTSRVVDAVHGIETNSSQREESPSLVTLLEVDAVHGIEANSSQREESPSLVTTPEVDAVNDIEVHSRQREESPSLVTWPEVDAVYGIEVHSRQKEESPSLVTTPEVDAVNDIEVHCRQREGRLPSIVISPEVATLYGQEVPSRQKIGHSDDQVGKDRTSRDVLETLNTIRTCLQKMRMNLMGTVVRFQNCQTVQIGSKNSVRVARAEKGRSKTATDWC